MQFIELVDIIQSILKCSKRKIAEYIGVCPNTITNANQTKDRKSSTYTRLLKLAYVVTYFQEELISVDRIHLILNEQAFKSALLKEKVTVLSAIKENRCDARLLLEMAKNVQRAISKKCGLHERIKQLI